MRTPKQAIAAALATHTNNPGWCQAQVVIWLGAAAAGDFDGDGAADAEDGWKKEPTWARRTDKTGRPGFPAAFLGGSHDNGHRALFVAPGILRSTDFNGLTKRYQPGVVGNGTVDEVAQAMGVTYAGWSLTMDGEKIPEDAPPPPPPPPPTPAPTSRGKRVDNAITKLQHAARRTPDGTKRDTLLKKAISVLQKITPTH